MRRACLVLLLLTAAALDIARGNQPSSDNKYTLSDADIAAFNANLSGEYELTKDEAERLLHNAKIQILDENGTIHILEEFHDDNSSNNDIGPHEPVVRGKRTLGDIVFRGLADVLGYSVQRRPTQIVFPPPVAPLPVQAAPPVQTATVQAAAVSPCQAVQAAAVSPCQAVQAAAVSPCQAAQAVAVSPCQATQAAVLPCGRANPPQPQAQKRAPCAQARAAQRKSPPCAAARAAPAPCAPSPQPPPPAQQSAPLETINSNFQLNFNWNRNPATPAADPAPATEQPAQEELQPVQPPVRLAPAPARLPPPRPLKPRVYVDAFVVGNGGVTQKIPTVDAAQYDPQQYDNADYSDPQDSAYYDEEPTPRNKPSPVYDYYEDAQESRNTHARGPRQQKNAKIATNFGTAIDKFWQGPAEAAKKPKTKQLKPPNHYQNVHFGDRNLYNDASPPRSPRRGSNVQLQSLVKESPSLNRIPVADRRKYNDAERLHYTANDYDDAEDRAKEVEKTTSTEDPHKVLVPRVLPPTENHPNQIDTITVRVPPIYREKNPRKLHRADRDEEENVVQEYRNNNDDNDDAIDNRYSRRAKKGRSRKSRSTEDEYSFESGDYDYFGNKLPISEEELEYRKLTVAPPTVDPDVARHESEGFEEDEKAADESERTDQLSPNAQVVESGYANNYEKATRVQVDDPNPRHSKSSSKSRIN